MSLLLDVEKIEFWMRIQEDEFMIFGVVLNYLLNKCLVGEDLVVNLIVSEIWYTHRRLDRDGGPHVQIGHCYREANSCVDFLARIGSCQNSDFILYNDPPVDLLELLSSDSAGLCCNRLVLFPPLPP